MLVHTIDGALHLVVVESDRRDSIVASSTNGADGKTVSTRAHRVLHRDVRARIDGHAVILVVHICARDDDVGTITNVKSIGIHTEGVTGFVVDGHIRDGETVGAVNGDGLDGRVVNVQIRNGRVGQVVRIKELGLGHSARATLAIPIFLTIAVENGARGAFDGDARALNLKKGPIPFGICPGGLALENDLDF